MPTYTLPELNTKGPSFLEGLTMGENIKMNRQRLNLMDIASQRESRQMDLQEKRFTRDEENQKVNSLVSIMSHAMSAAALADTEESAQSTIKQFEGIAKRVDPSADFSMIKPKFKGENVEIPLDEDGSTISGPRIKVAALAKMFGEDPKYNTPEGRRGFNVLAAQNGVVIKKSDKGYVPKTKEEKLSLIEAEKKIEAKYRAPEAKKAFLTPANTVEYLPNNVTPPSGWVPYQQGIEFETTTPEGVTSRVSMGGLPNKPSKGRVLPAEEAGKLGEVKSYVKTMEELNTMVKDKKIDTGPLEFLREKWDNWTGLGSKDRLRLRAITARLPGVLYSMRGKQLSDKELEVGMKMMPKMNTQEEVFANDLSAFEEYISMTREERVKAFSDAGYKMDKFDPKDVDVEALKQSVMKTQRKAGLKQYYEK